MDFYNLNKPKERNYSIIIHGGASGYTKDDFETTVAMMEQGRIQVGSMITDVISLDELPDAFEALRMPSEQCKVLTKFG